MTNAMGQMNLGPAAGNPPPMQQPPPPPMRMMNPNAAAGGGGMPPPPGAPQMQMMQPGAPRMMAPPPPKAAAPPAPGQMMHPPAAAAPMATHPTAMPQQPTLDTSIHCPSRFFTLTSNCIPQHMGMVHNSKVPLGGIIRPLAPMESAEDEEVDVVQPTAAGIVRCKKCRLYMNPFVQWIDTGRRWRCNICLTINDTPSAYYCNLEADMISRRDKYDRPELCKGVVEYQAPSEYMVRPPQPPAYFFVIDVGFTAVNSGVLADVAAGIREKLEELPGGRRVQIGFITFDRTVHYYSLKSGLSSPQMMGESLCFLLSFFYL